MSYWMTLFGLSSGVAIANLFSGGSAREWMHACIWMGGALFAHWLSHGRKR